MTPEQQFQQFTETANEIPGDLQKIAYVLLTICFIFLIIGFRKSYRYVFKLDKSERNYTGWGARLYTFAFGFGIFGYFALSMSKITAMIK